MLQINDVIHTNKLTKAQLTKYFRDVGKAGKSIIDYKGQQEHSNFYVVVTETSVVGFNHLETLIRYCPHICIPKLNEITERYIQITPHELLDGYRLKLVRGPEFIVFAHKLYYFNNNSLVLWGLLSVYGDDFVHEHDDRYNVLAVYDNEGNVLAEFVPPNIKEYKLTITDADLQFLKDNHFNVKEI